ncbi:MAG: SDR family oxidoreductase [Deltaproteobacteria bacterium]|nr:SDR family oxidoreductase [Deltaproteobacteria bacterium]MCB9785691.1 SDR family oxidoreductase [Deltaproteobacteria bacterium]
MPTALVTGANRGIGLELSRGLIARGYDLVAVCRQRSPELAALPARIEDDVDVTSGADVAALATRLAGVTLDLLVNNAGILLRGGLDDLDLDGVRRQLEVNAIAPLRLTRALLPRMARPAKIAMITSRMGSIGDNSSGGAYGYRMSKAALNAASVSLAHDLRGREIAVAILHPGYVRTDMTGGSGQSEPAEAAAALLDRIEELTLENSGTFWHAQGEVLPW